MTGNWRRLLMVFAIGAIAPASAWPVSAEVEHHGSGCSYERAREAAAAAAAASSSAISLFELSRSASGLTP